MNRHDLSERIAIVTGASAGIGEAIALELASRGAAVVINARREDKLSALADRLAPARVAAVIGDCVQQPTIDRLLDTARQRFGRQADLVVINAGRGLRGSVFDSDVSQWEEMIRTNFLGAALLARAAAHRMVEQVAARTAAGQSWLGFAQDIVILGSTVGRNVSPFSSMYGATKFAVHGLAEGLRRELGPKGIRVSLLAPGFVESEFQAVAGYDPKWFEQVKERIGPPLTPADVARVVGFVASQPASVHVADILLRPTRQDYP